MIGKGRLSSRGAGKSMAQGRPTARGAAVPRLRDPARGAVVVGGSAPVDALDCPATGFTPEARAGIHEQRLVRESQVRQVGA